VDKKIPHASNPVSDDEAMNLIKQQLLRRFTQCCAWVAHALPNCTLWKHPTSAGARLVATLLFTLTVGAQPTNATNYATNALDPSMALTQYQNDHWQTEQGLPQNTVQSLLQTRDGYLWVGTMDGLARFDGVRFTVFDVRSVPELGSGSILGLMEDAEGNLWIGRNGSAVLYRKGRFQIAFGDELTAGKSVWSFCQGQDGVVWAATDNGLVRWQNGSARVYHQSDGLPTEKLRALTLDRDGTLWIGTTGGGLVSFSGERFETYSPSNGFPHQSVRAVIPDPDGGVWAATAGGGLAYVRNGKTRTYTTANGLPTNQLSTLAMDSRGTIWIGTWGFGLCRMTAGRFSSISSASGLSGDKVWSLLVDREGSLWIGDWVEGLNRLRNRRFLVFGVPEGLSHDNVRSVLRASNGVMWVATAGGGVNRLDGKRITSIRKKDGLPTDETSTLCEDRDGSLWIGTYTSGLAHLKKGRVEKYGMGQGLPSADVRSLYLDRAGSIWAGTYAGLARFNGRAFEPVKANGALIDGVVPILEDRTGTLWFGTSAKGLFRLRDGKFTTLTKQDGLGSNRVLALHEDQRGSLWIGTSGGGLSRLRNGKIVTIKPSDGLWDGIIQTILEDQFGNFWMTCNRGFFYAPSAELDAFAEGRITKVTSVGYGSADSLRSATFAGGELPSGAVDSRGRLWFPSYKGLLIVDPTNLPKKSLPPEVRLEDVSSNGVVQSDHLAIVLPPGHGSLLIRYTAMTLVNAERVRFRYRLDGLQADWVDGGTRREAFFPSLSHGKFQFRVAASTDGLNWSEAPTPLAITVKPLFRQTYWFLLLIFLGVNAAAALTFRLRTVRFRRRHAEMQRLVREKTEELREANEHLSRLSFLDPLTGLANRRRFDEALDKEWRRAQRFGTSVGLVMADVDSFKAYNDALGHPAGDRCLVAIADAFLHSVGRPGDVAARYGGEEFIVLVPGADHAEALAFAELLRCNCEALAIPHPASASGAVVTISLGVAALIPKEGMPMESLISQADAALYRAKHGGRNQVA
jgi:diguanylate cyclase (GGDEF)-like protein